MKKLAIILLIASSFTMLTACSGKDSSAPKESVAEQQKLKEENEKLKAEADKLKKKRPIKKPQKKSC
ncbi:hypothetical protein AZ66_07260 [Paenibacillus sp. E194]|uniref:hypothetical protein n=1 Tax=Paenibacillus sp. E194 TaxID=1458845 RepID=UPI0005C94C97|nr:hypothetical protein [Paenibacillus sp. E194]KJB88478.1 hypothetical protein AZ66_07260 [Paenibacillus sp. E194]